jgi:hypothetical protein
MLEVEKLTAVVGELSAVAGFSRLALGLDLPPLAPAPFFPCPPFPRFGAEPDVGSTFTPPGALALPAGPPLIDLGGERVMAMLFAITEFTVQSIDDSLALR